jgi:hypothetical protein
MVIPLAVGDTAFSAAFAHIVVRAEADKPQ